MRRFPIKKAKRELRYINSLSELEFETWVEKKKWEQFNHFRTQNNFYKEFIDGHIINNWEDIPIISKTNLQQPLRQLISLNYELDDLFINNTSGSSGTPFFFAKDKYAHSITWANVLEKYKDHGIEYGKSWQARFYGIPLNGKKLYVEKVKDFISRRIRFPIFDLSDEVLNRFVKQFANTPFDYINGYTSALVCFAQYLVSNQIVLKSICPTLKVAFPTSEMCSMLDRKVMEEGFGVPVANEYGCAEVDVLAFENPNHEWILSQSNVFFEVVDDSNRTLPLGSEGNLVITSLHNKAMPFIRYKVGDVAKINPVCSSKKLVLENLVGRINEFALLPSNRKVPALTFYYITKTLIQEQYGVKEFVVKQLMSDTFQFEYVSENELPDDAIQKIQNAMNVYLEPGLKSFFLKKTRINRTPAGKFKQFECLIDK